MVIKREKNNLYFYSGYTIYIFVDMFKKKSIGIAIDSADGW